ncbi:TPA: DedA family protein [Staphylococcus aureus]
MEQIITEFISRFGYAAIFILILLENVLPIVPSEIILTFAVFICRFIPVLRVLITIPAGVNRMNVVTFTVISLIGTTIWNFGLILLGRTLSDSFGMLMTGLHTYSRIMYVVIIIAVIYFAIRYIGKRKRVK